MWNLVSDTTSLIVQNVSLCNSMAYFDVKKRCFDPLLGTPKTRELKIMSLCCLKFLLSTDNIDAYKQEDKGTVEQQYNLSCCIMGKLIPKEATWGNCQRHGGSFRKSFSSLGHSFFPGNHSGQRGSKRFLSTYWNHTAHYSPMR